MRACSGVTERGEWEEWLGYFLAGVAGQAEDALGRIRRIDDLLARWRERLVRSPRVCRRGRSNCSSKTRSGP